MPGFFSAVLLYWRRSYGVRSSVFFVVFDSNAENVSGFPFSFGVLQQYYTTHPPFESEGATIAVIGTLASVGLVHCLFLAKD